MSVTSVDSTKPKPFINVEPPKTEAKKPAINQDAPANAPPPDFKAFLAAQTAPPAKLEGPGVSAGVFGAGKPNVKAMSDVELGKNIAKLTDAMKKNPGKVNDGDFHNLKTLLDAAQLRSNGHLNSTKAPADMNNRELFASLVAFDAAKASGAKLTKDQEARLGALEGEWKKRGKFDAGAEIKFLEKERKHLEAKMVVHCAAAAAGATSLATHNAGIGMAGSALVIAHAASEGHYGEVAFESVLALAARIPVLHKGAEGVALAANTLQCIEATGSYNKVGNEIDRLKAGKK